MKDILGSNTLVVIKNGRIIFTSDEKRLKPVISCIISHEEEMEGAQVYDRVTGLAAARLLSYVRVSEIHTLTASIHAKNYLAEKDIVFTAEDIVAEILNDSRTDTCPMEKLAQDIVDSELYDRLIISA